MSSGLDPNAIDSMDLTGHLTISIFQRYHIGDERTRHTAARKLAAFHEEERQPKTKKVVVLRPKG